MSKEKLITFATAKIAKEKGFNIRTKHYFDYSTGCSFSCENKEATLIDRKVEHNHIYSRPTQSELQAWLRDKQQIFVEIQTDCTTAPKFCFEINKFIGNPLDLSEKEWSWYFHKEFEWFLYRTHEEALEEGLKEALKLI